jgi:hypothetical protein
MLILGGAALMLIETLQEADEVNSGNLNSSDEKDYGTSLGLIIAGGVIGITGGVMSKKAFKKSAETYNRNINNVSYNSLNGIQLSENTFLNFQAYQNRNRGNELTGKAFLKYRF